MAWVWEHSRAEPTERLVLLAIADCANDRGEAWPSMAALVGKTRLSERTIQRAVQTLVDLGELVAVIGGGRGRTTKYRLPTKAPADNPRHGDAVTDTETPSEKPRKPDDVSEKPRQRNPVTVTETPSTSAENPVTVTPGTVIEPSREPLTTSSSEPASRPDVEQICAHLADWIERNGSKRPTITKRWRDAARLLLDRDGRTVDQVMRAIDWCQTDEFWRGVILSMPKLREKYDQLRLAAKRSRGSPQRSTTDERVSSALELAARFERGEIGA